MRWTAFLATATFALTGLACADDDRTFSRQGGALLAETEALIERAADFDQDVVLRSLGTNARNGFHLRLEDAQPTSVDPSGPVEAPNATAESGMIPLAPLRSRQLRNGATQVIDYERGDTLESGDLQLEKGVIAEFELRIKVETISSIELGWSSELEPVATGPGGARLGERTVYVDTIPDGRFHTYRIDAARALMIAKEPGDIRRLFLRPSRRLGERIELAHLRVVGKAEKFSRQRFGTAYEEIGDVLRSVLYVRTPLSLRYTVALPRGPLFFRTGLSVLNPGDAIAFRVRVHEGGDSETVLERSVDSADQWRDEKVDLSRFGGKNVTVELWAESRGGNVAFWANPVIYQPAEQRFNVVFIVQDTLRADRLSAYGHGRETSPHFDSLAERGVLFEYAMAQATKTRPSVAAMMTGLYPVSVGVWNFHEVLDDRFVTLAEVLRSQGFATAAFIGNPNAGPYAGVHQGFDFLVHRFEGRRRQPDERYLIQRADAILGEGVSRWLDTHSDRNFFLYLHLVDPHAAYDAPPPYDQWYQEARDAGRPIPRDPRIDPPEIEHPTDEGRRRMYDGEIRYNDAQIARFLENLAARGLLEDSLLIFASDHGEFLGERDPGQWLHHPPGYMQVLHVPLMLVLPGVLPEGLRVKTPVQLIDIVPTALDLAGIETDGLILQGHSLVPMMESREGDVRHDRVVVSEEVIGRAHGDTRPWGSVFFRGEHFLNSRKFFDADELSSPDLDVASGVRVYRYEEDRKEAHNRTEGDDERALRAETSAFLSDLVERNHQLWKQMTGAVDPEIRVDPDVREQLRGLGYLE